MKLLLVEDDENKQREVAEFLRVNYPKLNIQVAGSLISALRTLKEAKPEAVLLDMTLPNYDVREGETGGGLHAFGGEEFLRQTKRFKVSTAIIVITQFESFGEPPDNKGLVELDAELKAKFPDLYKGAVYYHASIFDWSHELTEMLEKFVPEILTCR